MVGTAVAGKLQANAASRAAKMQADAATKAAELQTTAANNASASATTSNDATLQFERDKEAERKTEWDKTQALNLEQFNADLARRQPYMNQGLGALAQMGQRGSFQSGAGQPQAGGAPGAPYAPLYSQTPAPPGSLADMLAKKQQAGA
jgi:hypothetical protein